MLRQISDVERVRASALAQQESVAIAQVNKVCSSMLEKKGKDLKIHLDFHNESVGIYIPEVVVSEFMN